MLYIASFNNKHGAVNGRRQVFDKMFETGNLECFSNDAWISFEKVEENYVELPH